MSNNIGSKILSVGMIINSVNKPTGNFLMKLKGKKALQQQLKELCQAHSELQHMNEMHRKGSNLSIISEIYNEKISDIGGQIISTAKSLFEEKTEQKEQKNI